VISGNQLLITPEPNNVYWIPNTAEVDIRVDAATVKTPPSPVPISR
jgi:hypothetical protein